MIEPEIIYRDDWLVAINKPHGMLAHPTPIAGDDSITALQWLRKEIQQRVFPVHRIDRKTSGVLLFALDSQANGNIQRLFRENQIVKKYLAIVRGYTPDSGVIEYPLAGAGGKKFEALTHYRTISRIETELIKTNHSTSRYSLVEVMPMTGRTHQIRRHFAHIHHPVIGDRPYGCNKQNRLFKTTWNMTSMMLHASELGFIHPFTNKALKISAIPSNELIRVTTLLGWKVTDIVPGET